MDAVVLERPHEAVAVEVIMIQCAWCGRIKRHGLYTGRGLPVVHNLNGHNVSHGICPACARRVTGGDLAVAPRRSLPLWRRVA